MARLAAFTIPGLECYIPSGDHLPPHIHVRNPGAWEIKVIINHVHHGNPELPYLPVLGIPPARAKSRLRGSCSRCARPSLRIVGRSSGSSMR